MRKIPSIRASSNIIDIIYNTSIIHDGIHMYFILGWSDLFSSEIASHQKAKSAFNASVGTLNNVIF